jgi:hypothetical protein
VSRVKELSTFRVSRFDYVSAATFPSIFFSSMIVALILDSMFSRPFCSQKYTLSYVAISKKNYAASLLSS